MIRKRTAIFFILLANIVLLVHAVVPHHHHHQEQVCMVSAHCQNDSKAHNHNTTAQDHEHDGSAGTDCCVLKQAVAIPSNLLKQDCKTFDSDNDFPDFDRFQCVLIDNGSGILFPIDTSVAKLQFISSNYFHSVNTSIGLRAPPIV